MRKPDGWNREKLLSDRNVSAWFQANLLRSKVSAEVDLRKLGLLTHRIGTTSEGVVTLAKKDPDELGRRLVRYAADLKRKGRLDTYILKTFSGLKAWLRFRRVTFDQYPRLRAVQGISLRTETVPTQEQLGRILGALSTRGRAMALLMAHSGLRPGAIAHEGSTGLRLRDLPDLSLTGGEPSFTKSPFRIEVPGQLSKTARDYVTFGTEEEATAILTYLSLRRTRGEPLTPESALIAVAPHQSRNWRRGAAMTSGFVSTETLTFELRTGIRKVQPAGTRWRPYVLRAYCSSRLLSAENAGKMTRDVREAILGHDLGVAGRYNLSKKLTPDQVEEMRAAYKRCEPFLSTVPTKEDTVDPAAISKMLLMSFGYREEELADVDLTDMTAIQDLVARKMGARNEDRPRQKVVSGGELAGYLDRGWTVVTALNPNQVVVNPPEVARLTGPGRPGRAILRAGQSFAQ
jgi:hypothetical protein